MSSGARLRPKQTKTMIILVRRVAMEEWSVRGFGVRGHILARAPGLGGLGTWVEGLGFRSREASDRCMYEVEGKVGACIESRGRKEGQ